VSRAVLGILLLDGLYVGLGAAVLLMTGVQVFGRARWIGLALITGWASFAILASLALVAGLSLSTWQIVLIAAGAAGVALLVARRRRDAEQAALESPSAGWRRWAALGGAVLLAAYLGVLVLAALFADADRNYDSWAFWLPKAESIFYFGGLDTAAGGFTSYDNPEYPPAIPALHAATFHFAGGAEMWALPLQAAILGAAFFVAAAALLSRRVPGWILWPCLLAVAVTPNIAFYLDSALADLPVAYLLGLAGIAGALWLRDGSRATIVLCGVFLAAAALAKSEGFALAIVLVAALALASLWTNRHRRPLLALAAAPIVALVVWKLWLAANDQKLESVLYTTSDLFRPGLLIDRADRATYASGELLEHVFDPGRWLLLAPVALVAGVALLLRRSALALFYVTWLVLGFGALVSVYWISNADVVWHVGTSADRVTASLVVFAGALLPLVLAELERGDQ
jgi:hypothetical protein